MFVVSTHCKMCCPILVPVSGHLLPCMVWRACVSVAQQTPTSQHLTTSSTMLKVRRARSSYVMIYIFFYLQPCLSLIVLVSSTCCSPVNFLGVPGYSQEVISPNIYPLRTALDVLQPGLGYGYGQYGYGYPWALNSFGLGKENIIF